MPSRADGSHGGRPRTHAVVQHDTALVGVGPYQVFHQCHRLLCRVIERSRLVFLRHEDDRSRVFVVGDAYRRQLHRSVAAAGEPFRLAPPVVPPLRRAGCHLRMIDRLPLVEYEDVLVLPQRHTFRVEMPRYTVFLPHEIIPPQTGLRQHEPRGEKSLTEQDDGASGLGNPPVLLPQRLKRNLLVPLRGFVPAVQHAVRQVGDDRIDAARRHPAHALKAVHRVYSVRLYHIASVFGSTICRALIHVQRPVRVFRISHSQRVSVFACLKLTAPSRGP